MTAVCTPSNAAKLLALWAIESMYSEMTDDEYVAAMEEIGMDEAIADACAEVTTAQHWSPTDFATNSTNQAEAEAVLRLARMGDEPIVWEDPPAKPHRTARNRQQSGRRDALKANPGRWMLWSPDISPARASHLRAEGFECRTIAHPLSSPPRVRLYVRWPL
jgi:hypothetical protein